MKTLDIAEAHDALAGIDRLLKAGGELFVVKHGRRVACILAPGHRMGETADAIHSYVDRNKDGDIDARLQAALDPIEDSERRLAFAEAIKESRKANGRMPSHAAFRVLMPTMEVGSEVLIREDRDSRRWRRISTRAR